MLDFGQASDESYAAGQTVAQCSQMVRKGFIRKDKRSEKRMGTLPRQHATDLSDAWDLSEFYYAKIQMRKGGMGGNFNDVEVM